MEDALRRAVAINGLREILMSGSEAAAQKVELFTVFAGYGPSLEDRSALAYREGRYPANTVNNSTFELPLHYRS